MERIIVFFAKKTMLVNVIVLAVLFVGGYYYFNLNREAFPSTDMDMMLIAVTYPGASILDVEQNAVIPIEEQLQGISGIDKYETTIIENLGIILVELDQSLPNRQPVKDEIFREMQNVPDLSTDVEEVTTYDLNPNKMSIYTLGVHFKEGMEGDERVLFDTSQRLEDDIIRLPGVAEVRIEGRTDPEIQIYVDPLKMQSNYIALSDVVNALAVRNVRATGGDMEDGNREQSVVTYGEFQNPMEAENTVIRSTFNGQRVLVKDIGRVNEGFEEKTTYMRVNKAPGYSLDIVKNENADIIKTIDEVNKYLEENAAIIPENVQVSVMGDNSRTINSLIAIVSSNLIQGFLIIFICLIIFLDFKSAMFTSLGMIFTMFACFIFMKVTNITFNTISLAAVITVLGMIVDNSIVVSENIFNFKQAGYKGLEATRLAVSDVVMPMVASTLTTVAAFFPLLTISGMMGKIINLFPKIVIFTLMVSLFQSIFLLPNQLQDKEDKYKNYKPKKKSKWKNPLDFDKDKLFDKMKIPYGFFLEKCLKVRYIVILCFILMLIGSFFLAQNSFKNFVLVYDTSADTIVINIETEIGSTKEYTTEQIARIEDVVASVVKPEELIALYTLVGSQVDQEMVSEEKGNLAGIMVYLVPAAERKRTADEIVNLINQEMDKTDIRDTVPVFTMNTKGTVDPGDPVDIKIIGNDTDLARQAAEEIKTFLATVPGVINIDDDDKPGKDELRIMLDYDKIAELGIDVQTVGYEARTAYYGTEATYIQELENRLDFRVQFDEKYTYDSQYLTNLLIPNSTRRLIYLHNIADLELTNGLSALRHYNGQRSISVTADLVPGQNTSRNVMLTVSEHFKDFGTKYRGLRLYFGGEAEETMEALGQLIFSFAMALIFVYVVLLLQLNRFIQPIMILTIIPFGMIGVFLGFALHRMPLSFMGVVGIIGLAGVVVNNGIILVDVINNIIERGVKGDPKKGVTQAIVDGCKQRLRPVFLTTVTTVVGLLPTAYGIGGRADIIIPICMALAYGLLFATLLTLVLLPCMFLTMFDLRLIKIPSTTNPTEEITTTITTTAAN